MATNFELEAAVPERFLLDPPMSSAKLVVKRSVKEFLPADNTTFTEEGVVPFIVSSTDSFWEANTARLKAQIDWSYTLNANYYNIYYILERGGWASLIKQVDIYATMNNQLIDRLQNWNTKKCLDSYLDMEEFTMNPFNNSIRETNRAVNFPGNALAYRIPMNSAEVTSKPNSTIDSQVLVIDFDVATPNLLTTGILRVGDRITALGLWFGTVVRIASATQIFVTRDGGSEIVGGGAATKIYKLYIIRNSVPARSLWNPSANTSFLVGNGFPAGNVVGSREGTPSSGSMTIMFNLDIHIFKIMMPLFVIPGGFRFEFTLEKANRAFYTDNTDYSTGAGAWGDNSSSLTYSIKYPRLLIDMTTPNEATQEAYVKQFESPSGLIYPLHSYRIKSFSGGAADLSSTYQISGGLRSVEKIFIMVKDSAMIQSSSNDFRVRDNNCLSMAISDYIKSYQFKVGTQDFPARPVNVNTTPANLTTTNTYEWYEHFRRVSGAKQLGLTYDDVTQGRIYNVAASLNNAAQAYMRDVPLIMCADFRRDDSEYGVLTGQDTSITPIDFILERNYAHNAADVKYASSQKTWPGSPFYETIVTFHQYLRIFSGGINTYN